MNKFLMVLVTLMVTMFAGNALAYDPPAAPANGGYVVDQAGKLSAGQIQQLNQKIDRISKSTKNEFGVLLLPNMGGDNIEDVANATYKKWGVGKRGLDNGCLIVVAIKERKSRIETGKGVEGEVTDLQSKDILLKNLNPHLRSGDFYGGFDDTLNALSTLMESRHNQKADPAPVATTNAPATPVADTSTTRQRNGGCDVSSAPAPSGGGTWVILLLLGVGGIVAILMARAAKRRREEEEKQRLAAAKRRREKEEQIRQLQVRLAQEKERKESLAKLATPAVVVPTMPSRPVVTPVAHVAVKPHVAPHPVSRAGAVIESVVPTRPVPRPVSKPTHTAEALVAGAAVLAAAEAAHEATLRREREEREESDRRSREEERQARAREDEERRARQRERDEEDRRRRDREDEDRRRRDSESSSYSSSSSSSSDYGSSSGGGFGGGDSGGGGSSSDW